MSRHEARKVIVQALYSWEQGNKDVATMLAFEWQTELEQEDMDFARIVIRGVLGVIDEIDALISDQLEHWQIERVAKIDLSILRLSTYALRYQGDIPSQVSIDEAVELAKEFSTDDAYRFVNGVIDGIRKRLVSG